MAYCKVAAPVYLFFVILERLYNFYRFGSLTQTYIPIFAREQRLQDPTLPANFPWSTPFHEGFLGALFKPEKSIFLFDPLLVVALVLLFLLWKRLSPEVRAYAVTSMLLLLGVYQLLRAIHVLDRRLRVGRSLRFDGGRDGRVASACRCCCGIARISARWIWRGSIAVIAISFVIQIASLAFWLPLEIYQMETFGHPTFVIALRFKNIVAFALGKMDAWGLNTDDMTYDKWDYVHITCWNFLPFLLRRVGEAPRWVVDTAFAVWIAAIALLGWALWRLRGILWRGRA